MEKPKFDIGATVGYNFTKDTQVIQNNADQNAQVVNHDILASLSVVARMEQRNK